MCCQFPKTQRYNDSAVSFFQGLLNKDDFENRQIKRVLDYESSLKGSRKKERVEQMKRVNYVSNNDAMAVT